MATTQKRSAQLLGLRFGGPSNGSLTTSLNSATTFLGFGFIPSESKTLSKVKILISTKTASPVAADWTLDLYSDNAGAPNVSIEGPKTQAVNPTAATWHEFTGFTTALTAGVQYWLVSKNINGTPATNFFTINHGNSNTGPVVEGTLATKGWTKRHTTDGSAWTVSDRPQNCGWRVEYSDGSFDGFPMSSIGTDTTNAVYSAREAGVKLVIPANATWNVRGLLFTLRKNGSPTGNPRARIYTGATTTPTLLATSHTILNAGLSTVEADQVFYFSSTQAIAGGTTIRCVLAEDTQSDASGNSFIMRWYGIENDANSKALMPWSMQMTYTTDGVTFVDTDTTVLPMGIILDTDGEFASAGGAAAVQFRGNLSGNV